MWRAQSTAVMIVILADRPDQSGYRVAQEALTNVHRHAGNVGTHIRVTYGHAEPRLTVTNDGPAEPPPSPLPSGGQGLVGLRELVRLTGGWLLARPTHSGGFEVTAVLPVSGEPVPSEPEAVR